MWLKRKHAQTLRKRHDFNYIHCMKRPISDSLLIYANVSRIPLVIFVSNLLNSAHKWKYRLSLSFLFRLLKHL